MTEFNLDFEREKLKLQQEQLQLAPLSPEQSGIAGQQAVIGPPPEPTTQSIASNIRSGLVEGIANVFGFPADIVDAAEKSARSLFGAERKDTPPSLMSSKVIKQTLFNLGVINSSTPRNKSERMVRRISQEVGGAFPVAGGLKLASKVRTPAQLAESQLLQRAGRQGAITRSVVESGGAGTAAGIAGEYTQDSSPGTQAGADLVSSVLGGGFTSGTIGLPGAVKAPFIKRRAGATDRALDDVAEALQEQVADPSAVAQQIDTSINNPVVPGERLTLSQTVNEPGLRGLEQQIAQANPRIAARINGARAETNSVLHEAFTETAPPNADPNVVASVTKARVNRVTDNLRERKAIAQQQSDNLASTGMTKDQANEVVQEQIQRLGQEWKDDSRVLFDSVDPEGVGRFSTSELKAAASKLIKGRPKLEAVSDTPDLVSEILKLNKTEPFSELRALRSRLLAEIRAEKAGPAPNANKLRKLNEIKDATESTLDGIGANTTFPEIASRYRVANRHFRDGAEVFRDGVTQKIVNGNLPQSATIDAYFLSNRKKGAKESIVRGKELIGDNPEAINSVRTYVFSRVFEEATDPRGKISLSKLSTWKKNNSRALLEYPEIKSDLEDFSTLQQRMNVIAAKESRVKAQVERGTVSLLLGRSSREIAADILRSKDPVAKAKSIKKTIKQNPEAMAGIRRSLWEELSDIDSPGVDVLGNYVFDPGKMEAFVRKHSPTLLAFGYDSKDIVNLKRIISQAKKIKNSATSESVVFGSKGRDAPVLALNQLLSRAYGIQRGVVGAPFVISEVSARVINKFWGNLTREEIRKALEQAVVDPKFAALLLRRNTTKNAQKNTRAIAESMFNKGLLPPNATARFAPDLFPERDPDDFELGTDGDAVFGQGVGF